jgi:hypothetical protein
MDDKLTPATRPALNAIVEQEGSKAESMTSLHASPIVRSTAALYKRVPLERLARQNGGKPIQGIRAGSNPAAPTS